MFHQLVVSVCSRKLKNLRCFIPGLLTRCTIFLSLCRNAYGYIQYSLHCYTQYTFFLLLLLYFEIIEILEGRTSHSGDLCLLIWPVPAYVFLDFDSKETSNVAELSHPEILLHLVVHRLEFLFGCCSDNHVVNVNKECILLRLLQSSACINIDPSYLVWIPLSCKSNQLLRTASFLENSASNDHLYALIEWLHVLPSTRKVACLATGANTSLYSTRRTSVHSLIPRSLFCVGRRFPCRKPWSCIESLSCQLVSQLNLMWNSAVIHDSSLLL